MDFIDKKVFKKDSFKIYSSRDSYSFENSYSSRCCNSL